MGQFYGWLLLSALLFILTTVTGLRTKDAWDKWHKKGDDSPTKMEQSINSSPNSTAYQAGRDIHK